MSLKVPFTCPQQNFEKKMIKVIYTITDFFGNLREVFSDFNKKMFRRVETVIKCTEGKTSKNTHEKLVFRFSWTLTRKTCSFTGKFLAGLSKLLSTCTKEPLKSNISERKSWKLQDFRIVFEVFGTMAEKFYQGWQNSNRCPLEQYMKFFFKRETFAIFPDSEQFLPSSKNFRQIFETRNLGIRGSFWAEKQVWNFSDSSTLLWSLIQKTLGR